MVEHTLGKGGVVSPILTSGTIFKISAVIADFLFLSKHLFSPILGVFIMALLSQLIGLFYFLFLFSFFYFICYKSRKGVINDRIF